MKRPFPWLAAWLGLALSLAACGPQTATPAPPASPSPVANAVLSSPESSLVPGGETATAGAPAAASAEVATPPAPVEAAPTPLSEAPLAVAPAGACVNEARFVRDVTIPDGTQFLPGQLLLNKWSVQNTGTCHWGPQYRLVLINGESLAAASEVALYPALAGATATWEISMVAPQTPGEYTSRWQARDPAGNLFGAVVFIKINVIPMPTAPSP